MRAPKRRCLASIHASPDSGNVWWRRSEGVSQNGSDADSTTSESMRGEKMRSRRTDLRRLPLGKAVARHGTSGRQGPS